VAEDFDDEDVEALKALSRKSRDSVAGPKPKGRLDGRRLRAVSDDEANRSHQLNVRVRKAIKEKAYAIARKRRDTITEVVETAIELYHEQTMKT
jgi:hypothetical protein